MNKPIYLTSVLAVTGVAVWAFQEQDTPRNEAAPAIGALRETLQAQVRLLSRHPNRTAGEGEAEQSPARTAGLSDIDGARAPNTPTARTAPGLPAPQGR
ncbi:hypothetical protein [Tropicimonas sediminicola]|uniref:Uncharacterized protein n=1 Tax=Tropicimonas sediminicola TaxID=1031541 RepID=A0A239GS12_9RHOB|nr:hypothetical protein [Tropicimonas sediminicola]SNS71283.1 hypothetical protein SAMN05421757_10359 [Tropicimonas sediminicola]